MARDLKAKVRLTADTKQANAGLKKTTAQLGLLGTATRGVTTALGGLRAAFAASAVGLLALLVGFVKLISLANEEEDAIQKLNASIGNLNGENELLSQSLQRNADALASVTTAGNEEILAIQAQIAIFIKDEEQIKALTLASLNFAAAQGINGVSAAQLLTKTVASTTNSLTRYGLTVEGAVGSTERFNSAIEALSKFQGQAAAAAAITSGQMGLLGDAFTDLVQEVGLLLTSLKGVSNLLTGLTSLLNQAGSGIKFLRTGVRDLDLSMRVIAESVLPDFIGKLLGLEGTTLQVVKAEEALRSELSFQDTQFRISKDAADLLKNGVEELKNETKETAAAEKELTEELKLQLPVVNTLQEDLEAYNSTLALTKQRIDAVTEAEERNTQVVVASVERRLTFRERERRGLGSQIIFGERTTVGGTFFTADETQTGVNGTTEIVRPPGAF